MGICVSKRDVLTDEEREANALAQATALKEAEEQARKKQRRKKRLIDIQFQRPLQGKLTGHTVRGIDTALELRTELHKVSRYWGQRRYMNQP